MDRDELRKCFDEKVLSTLIPLKLPAEMNQFFNLSI